MTAFSQYLKYYSTILWFSLPFSSSCDTNYFVARSSLAHKETSNFGSVHNGVTLTFHSLGPRLCLLGLSSVGLHISKTPQIPEHVTLIDLRKSSAKTPSDVIPNHPTISSRFSISHWPFPSALAVLYLHLRMFSVLSRILFNFFLVSRFCFGLDVLLSNLIIFSHAWAHYPSPSSLLIVSRSFSIFYIIFYSLYILYFFDSKPSSIGHTINIANTMMLSQFQRC